MTRLGKVLSFVTIVGVIGVSPVSAQTILFQDLFDGPSAALNGTNGWKSYYCADTWQRSNGRAVALTDDGCTCAAGASTCNFLVTTGQGGCGASDPIDNIIINGDGQWGDYEIKAGFQHSDDDTIGIAFRHVNSANMYLFFMTNGLAPTANECQTEIVGSRLFKIVDGDASQIASSTKTYTVGAKQSVRIRAKGNTLDVYLDSNGDALFTEGELLFALSDNTSPFLTGRVGMYSFQSGLADPNCDNAPCGFTDIVISTIAEPPTDTDGDTIPDGADNCPQTPNIDQDDTDNDGVGDACDETPFPDADGDGVTDANDNCPDVNNPNQANFDLDETGDVCDDDDDNDGVPDADDNCPFLFNPEQSQVDPDCKFVVEEDAGPSEDISATDDVTGGDDVSTPEDTEQPQPDTSGNEPDQSAPADDDTIAGSDTGGNNPGTTGGNVSAGAIAAGGVAFGSSGEEESGCSSVSPRSRLPWGVAALVVSGCGLWILSRRRRERCHLRSP